MSTKHDSFRRESEWALDYADEAKIKASEYRQMGFAALAKWLDKNADAARLWASKQMKR